MIKSRRMRWGENVVYMGDRTDAHRILVGTGGHLEDPGVDGRIIIR
jgi:hypothetical protein